MRFRTPRAVSLWAAAVAPGLGFVAVTARGPLADLTWAQPTLALVVVVSMTALCLVGAALVVAAGWRNRLAEVAFLGAALAVQSFLSLVHGLSVPGALIGDNTTVTVAAFASVPAALLVALPLVFAGAPVLRAVGRAWRVWVTTALAGTAALGAGLIASPDLVPAPTPGTPIVVIVALFALTGTLVLSARQLRLYRLARRRASIVASIGFVYLGLSTLVWLGAAPYSPGWWGAHVADGTGVLLAALGVLLAHRRDRSITATLAPVVNRDPLVALELGLTPVVHRFIDALNEKDLVTRDHVVRVGELAMRVGLRAGLPPERIHVLGLAALLHDVGKLNAPTEILQKAGPLTDDEFALMKRHTVWGHQLMLSSPLLAPAALHVRWHHERADGAGYPDALAGDEIPLDVAIIAVCDAWDAMTFTRPYRPGMEHSVALDILRRGAGTQWSPAAVALLSAELAENGAIDAPLYDRLERAGSYPEAPGADGPPAVCPEALPAGVT